MSAVMRDPASPSATPGLDASSALNDAVSGEDAAIYAYGVIGPHLTGAARAMALQAELDHRNLRDQISEAMAAPPAAAAVYRMPFPVTDAASALSAAVTVEERVSVLWRAAAVAASDDGRQTALLALINGAVRTAAFRRAAGAYPGTTPFPGLS
jgi:hypothetical protein